MRKKQYLWFLPVLFCTKGYTYDLAQIYLQAQQKDPIVLQAKAERDATYARIGTTRANLLPQIRAGGELARNSSDNNSSDTTTNALSISLSQSIFNKANWDALDASKQQAALSELNYEKAQQELLIRTTQAYFNVLKAQDDLAFAKANEEAVNRQLTHVQKRYEVGLTAITDVQEATASHHQTLADVITAENAVSNRKEELRQLTGQFPQELALLDTQRFSTPGTGRPLDKWEEHALQANITLQMSRLSQKISKTDIYQAQAGHYPTLDLSVTGQSQHIKNDNSSTSSNSTDGRSNTAQLGLSLSIPLFLGGSTHAQVKTAQANYVKAAQELESARRQVIRDLHSYFNNVQANKSSVEAYTQLVVSAQTALDATQAGYNVGTRTTVDVLDATQKVFSAKSKLSEARYQYIINILQLKYAGGLLQEQDLMAINEHLKKV